MRLGPITPEEAKIAHKIYTVIFFVFQAVLTAGHVSTDNSKFQTICSLFLTFLFASYVLISVNMGDILFRFLFLIHIGLFLMSCCINFSEYSQIDSLGWYFMVGYVFIHLIFVTSTIAVAMKKNSDTGSTENEDAINDCGALKLKKK